MTVVQCRVTCRSRRWRKWCVQCDGQRGCGAGGSTCGAHVTCRSDAREALRCSIVLYLHLLVCSIVWSIQHGLSYCSNSHQPPDSPSRLSPANLLLSSISHPNPSPLVHRLHPKVRLSLVTSDCDTCHIVPLQTNHTVSLLQSVCNKDQLGIWMTNHTISLLRCVWVCAHQITSTDMTLYTSYYLIVKACECDK